MTTATSSESAWVPELTFAARLALVRNRMGWNAKEAALACGLPAQSWRNWEAGKRPHDHERVCQVISARTGVSVLWLAMGDRGVTMNARYGSDNWGVIAGAA